MATRKPKKTAEPSPQRDSAVQRFVQRLCAVDSRLARLPQPLAISCRLVFFIFAVAMLLVVGVAALLVILLASRVYGLVRPFLFGKRKAVVWLVTLLAVGFFLGMVMSFFYQSEDNERLAGAWGKLAFWCGGVGMGLGIIAWFRNPTFYPDAAKGYAVGQVLNNQREIREELRDISDHLNH